MTIKGFIIDVESGTQGKYFFILDNILMMKGPIIDPCVTSYRSFVYDEL